MTVVAIIQARVGSTRLPGKVMYPLGGMPVLKRIVQRLTYSNAIDNTVIATSNQERDRVIERLTGGLDATVYRGSETDVLGRLHAAAEKHGADIVVRLCADNPLIPPRLVDAVVDEMGEDIEYVSNHLERTFPRGMSVEACTMESFERIEQEHTEPRDREHVTLAYRENPETFTTRNIRAADVFSDSKYIGRSDLRLTLDRASDYDLLSTVFEAVVGDPYVSFQDAIDCIDERNLQKLNNDVEQVSV